MKIMAIDLGDVRTGIAICDKFEILAIPICVIEERSFNQVVDKILTQILSHKVGKVVIGYPKHMNGSIGQRAKKSEMLVNELKKSLPDIPIVLWDERITTKMATRFLHETNTKLKKRKKIIDAVAATIILESYLNFHNKTNNQNK